MKKFYEIVVKNQKKILVLFIVMAVVGLIMQNMVNVNYNLKDYLPEESPSTVALDKMEAEYDGGIPNARVMVKDVSIAEALQYKEEIKNCVGVTGVTWLDDSVDVTLPVETMDEDTVDTYYKDGNALFTVTVDEDQDIEAINEIREVIGDDNAMTGDIVATVASTTGTISEIQTIVIIAVIFVFFVLMITTTSWIEPVIVLLGLGVAIAINAGTNLIFGTISFVTNSAGNILQLAVSLDYSVFLIHRFQECLQENDNEREAMVDALCKSTSSIASSGLTTVIGFLALVFMEFKIGPDLGLALAKGVAISLITVFIFMPNLILALHGVMKKTEHRSFMPSFEKFGKFVYRAMIPFVLVFILIIAPAYLASNSNDYYYGSAYIYGKGTTYRSDTNEIEAVYGKDDTYVIMVPKGDLATQRELSDELHTVPEVKTILSYVDTVGETIPSEYLSEDTLSLLESEHFTRFVLTVEADSEGQAAFDLVEELRGIANKYYPDEYYMAGTGVSSYDLMDTITKDTIKVNLISILAVFVVMLLSMKSISLPVILVLGIETAIWINLGIPYFRDSTVFYISYLIISSIQLGATVDYAILLTDRYMDNRKYMNKKDAVQQTIPSIMVSVLTSGSVLSVVGFLLGKISKHGVLSQLGNFLGVGTIFSLIIVVFVLPGMLYLFDGLIEKTTLHAGFYKESKETKENENEDEDEDENHTNHPLGGYAH